MLKIGFYELKNNIWINKYSKVLMFFYKQLMISNLK